MDLGGRNHFADRVKAVSFPTLPFRRQLTLGPGPCSLRAGLASQGGWYNLRGKMEEVSQVLDAFIGKIPIIVPPGKLLLDIAARLQGLGEERESYSRHPK